MMGNILLSGPGLMSVPPVRVPKAGRMRFCPSSTKHGERLSFKGFAGLIGDHFVVSAHHRDLPAILETDLGRAENMTSRMEGNRNSVYGFCLLPSQSIDSGMWLKSNPQNSFTLLTREIVATTPSSVISVSMCDESPLNGFPGVNVSVCLG